MFLLAPPTGGNFFFDVNVTSFKKQGKTMSGKRGKLKETVEEEFETFVRHQLSSISDDLKEMKGTQVQIQRDIESLQSQTKKNESSISKLNKRWI